MKLAGTADIEQTLYKPVNLNSKFIRARIWDL